MNSVSFVGYLGGDPQLRYLQNGTAVCNFNVGVTVGFGESKDTVWTKCTVWGKQAENASNFLKKGNRVQVVGEFGKVETFQRSNGEFAANMTVRVERFQNLTARGESTAAAPAE